MITSIHGEARTHHACLEKHLSSSYRNQMTSPGCTLQTPTPSASSPAVKTLGPDTKWSRKYAIGSRKKQTHVSPPVKLLRTRSKCKSRIKIYSALLGTMVVMACTNPQAYHAQLNHIRMLSCAPCLHGSRGESPTRPTRSRCHHDPTVELQPRRISTVGHGSLYHRIASLQQDLDPAQR